LLLVWKNRIELVEIDLLKSFRIIKKGVAQFALRPIRQEPRRQGAPHDLLERRRNELTVSRAKTQVPERSSIFKISGQDFFCTFAGAHHLYFFSGKASHLPKGNAGRPHKWFAFLPNHLR